MNILITGGAGFIGTNVADHHLGRGDRVVILDNVSRAGTRRNLSWLSEQHGDDRLTVIHGDVRDARTLDPALSADTERVYHLAAQVAVTTSVLNPREDFEINALGTFNMLEAVRMRAPQAVIIYASTNKVYGGMESTPVVKHETRYAFRDLVHGVPEDYPLDFHSPYGCSKGCGDQYVRDYARIYGLRTIVMRQSCIYGERQMGAEDQGWVAHFCIASQLGRPITIYGDGRQLRDVLWVGDLIDCYERAAARADTTAGRIYNAGGGPRNTVSIWREFGALLEELAGRRIPVSYSEWRPGDQPVYVSDIRRAEEELAWEPQVTVESGLERIWKWVDANHDLFA